MIRRIKKILGYFILRKHVLIKNVRSFKNFYSESSRILLSVPMDTDARNSVLKFISELISDGKKVILIVHDNLKSIYVYRQGISLQYFSEEELTKLKLPGKVLESKIKETHCDLFIDLDFMESLLNYGIAALSDTKFKVGFKKEKSDRFYNFQVPMLERNYEFSYENLLNSLRMF